MKWIARGHLVILSALVVAFTVSSGATRPAPPLDADRIEQRIQEIQPTAKERRFEAIGWIPGIRAAERLAREHGRPVFLFSNVGQMDIGRC
jgi:hypothetical protein